ncbi:MAG TPA: 30S ribosomal protein S17 [Elusimicrobia bacterium]|nr:30S ribosomal protein S17 [Elusimicrobiota bacterium]
MKENAPERPNRKIFRGVVVSDRMNKTRVISVERTLHHAAYAKTIKRNAKYYAHDESNESHSGDTVEIMSTRPMSSLKRWRISRVIAKAAK